MNNFAKAAVAVTLLAGAGAANATIAYDKGGDNEAYLSAYDFTTGKTYTFDTGVSYNTLVANVSNAAFSLDFDFSADSNWLNFLTGANLGAIKYTVTVGNSIDFGAMITSNSVLADGGSIIFGLNTAQTIENHAIDINSGFAVNNAQNLSKLVLDTDPAGLGQHAGADSAWGGWIQDPQGDYGQAIGFQLGQLDFNTGGNIASTFAGKWMLAGNSLTYAVTSAVPVPGAVWLFGSALIGMLGVNRRKAVAA